MIVSDIVAADLPWWVRHNGILIAACAGGAISKAEYLADLTAAGLYDCRVLARQHYKPVQMASLVVDPLPQYLQNAPCCGKPIAMNILTKVAKPISKKTLGCPHHSP